MNISQKTFKKKVFNMISSLGLFLIVLVYPKVVFASDPTLDFDLGPRPVTSITESPIWRDAKRKEGMQTGYQYTPIQQKYTKIKDMSDGIKKLNGMQGVIRAGQGTEVMESPDTLVYPINGQEQWIEFSNVGIYPDGVVSNLKVIVTPPKDFDGKERVSNQNWIGIKGNKFLSVAVEGATGVPPKDALPGEWKKEDQYTEVTYAHTEEVVRPGGGKSRLQAANFTFVLSDSDVGFVHDQKMEKGADLFTVSKDYSEDNILMPVALTRQWTKLAPFESSVEYRLKEGTGYYPRQKRFTLTTGPNQKYAYKIRPYGGPRPYPYVVEYQYFDERGVENPYGREKKIDKVTEDKRDISFEFVQEFPKLTPSKFNKKTEWNIKLDELPSHLKTADEWLITDNYGRNRINDFNVDKKSGTDYTISVIDNTDSNIYDYDYTFKLPIEFTDKPIDTKDLEAKKGSQYLKATGKLDFWIDGQERDTNTKMSVDINVGYKVKYRYLLDGTNEEVDGSKGLKTEDTGYISQPFKASAPSIDKHKLNRVEPVGAATEGFTLDKHPNGDKEVTFYYEEGATDPDISWNSPTESEPRVSTKELSLDMGNMKDTHQEPIYVNTIDPGAEYYIVTKKKGDIIDQQKVGPTEKSNTYIKKDITIQKKDLVGGENEYSVELFRTDETEFNSADSLSTLELKVNYALSPPDISWNSPTESEPRVSTKDLTLDIGSMTDYHQEPIYVNTIDPGAEYYVVTKKKGDIVDQQKVGPTQKSNTYIKKDIIIQKEDLVEGENEFSVELFRTDADVSKSENSISTLTLNVHANGTLKFEKVPTELKWTNRKIRETKGTMARDAGNDMEFIIKDSRGTDSRNFSLWVSAEYQSNVKESPFSLKWKEQNNQLVDLNVGGGAHKILSHTMGKETDFKTSWDPTKGVLLSSDNYVLAGDYNNLMTVLWTISDTENAN